MVQGISQQRLKRDTAVQGISQRWLNSTAAVQGNSQQRLMKWCLWWRKLKHQNLLHYLHCLHWTPETWNLNLDIYSFLAEAFSVNLAPTFEKISRGKFSKVGTKLSDGVLGRTNEYLYMSPCINMQILAWVNIRYGWYRSIMLCYYSLFLVSGASSAGYYPFTFRGVWCK